MKKLFIVLFILISFSTFGINTYSFLNIGSIGIDINTRFDSTPYPGVRLSLLDFQIYEEQLKIGLNSSILGVTMNEEYQENITLLNTELYYNIFNYYQYMRLGPFIDVDFGYEEDFISDSKVGLMFQLFLPVSEEVLGIYPTMNMVKAKVGYSLLKETFNFSLTTDLGIMIYAIARATYEGFVLDPY